MLDDILGKPQSEIDETENKANNAAEELIDDGIVQEESDKMINNAAEELDGHKLEENKNLRNDEMDLEIINRGNDVKDRLHDQKLNDEIAGDHGKEAGYPEDLHMIEGQNEENDDLGDGELILEILRNILTILNFNCSWRLRSRRSEEKAAWRSRRAQLISLADKPTMNFKIEFRHFMILYTSLPLFQRPLSYIKSLVGAHFCSKLSSSKITHNFIDSVQVDGYFFIQNNFSFEETRIKFKEKKEFSRL